MAPALCTGRGGSPSPSAVWTSPLRAWRAAGKEPLLAETVYDPQKHRFRVTLPPIDNMRDVTVSLPDGVCLAANNRAQYCETLLNRAAD